MILEANGDLRTVEMIGNVLTKVQGLPGFVRLKGLMNVRRGYQDPVDKPVYFNGMPAVILVVEMSDEEDIQKIGAELEHEVAAYELTQPIGITYQFSTFQETNVTTSINAALMNVAQTFIVVLAVMLIFLGFRAALIIACIVPFTVTFALVGMGIMEIDLQQISIAAVIISLGLLVDNGLVVVEDIQGRISCGFDPNEAALAAGRQFFVPLAVDLDHHGLGLPAHAHSRRRRGRVRLFAGCRRRHHAGRLLADRTLHPAIALRLVFKPQENQG